MVTNKEKGRPDRKGAGGQTTRNPEGKGKGLKQAVKPIRNQTQLTRRSISKGISGEAQDAAKKSVN